MKHALGEKKEIDRMIIEREIITDIKYVEHKVVVTMSSKVELLKIMSKIVTRKTFRMKTNVMKLK